MESNSDESSTDTKFKSQETVKYGSKSAKDVSSDNELIDKSGIQRPMKVIAHKSHRKELAHQLFQKIWLPIITAQSKI